LILAAVTTAGSSVYADKISIEQAPPAVQKAIKSRAGRQPVEDIDRDTRNGQVTYEASWKNNGAQQELLVSEAGTILRDVAGPSNGLANKNVTLANRVGIGLTETPQAVQNAIHSQFPNGRVEGVQRGIWNGQTVYEVRYHDNGQLQTYQFNETGQPIVSGVPATRFQPRYAGLADTVVPLSAGAKMAFDTAPRAVQTTVNHIANGARVEDFERGTWNGRTVYQAAFKRNGQHTELQVLDDGTIVGKAPVDSAGSAQASAQPGSAPTTTASTTNPQAGPDYGNTYLNRRANRDANGARQPRYAGLADQNVQLSGGSKVQITEAPRSVQNTITRVANGAQIEDLERGTWNGRTVYEAAFKRNGQTVELQVLEDGSVLTKDPGSATGSPAAGVTGTAPQ